MDAPSSPGEDFYRALVDVLIDAPAEDMAIVLGAIAHGHPAAGLTLRARAIFSAAAAKFLSE